MKELIAKYNTPVPRYTSYPTVPNWDAETFSKESYLMRLQEGFARANKEGLSLYIHLPYCESLCTYCGCNTRITVNHAVEEPYIKGVLKEWELVSKYFTEKPLIREIHLGGGTPTFFSPDNLAKLVEGILKTADVSEDASFSFEAHPANTTSEHLKKLRSIGFDRLSLGVQDFDPKVQKAINRLQTEEDILRVIRSARDLGYRSVNFDLVYGLPFQTLSGVVDAVSKVIDMRPDRIAFYSYAHVPWMKPGQRAYDKSDLPTPELKLALFTEGRQMLLNAGYKPIGFDHFALPGDSLSLANDLGKMHRNFMGFSDLKTPYQIGLGVSSISDIGNGFAQNTKVVESYLESIEKNELPIFKGHIHNPKDEFVRDQILNLTCKHRTSWSQAPLCFKEFMRKSCNNLEEAVEEGLVRIGTDEVEITPEGRFFVRHICSAFDPYFEQKPAFQRYSQGV
jgi:oxygen-independent coproporphyrinogen-3 oxidase